MACFIVPVTEAVITTVAGKVIRSKEMKQEKTHSGSGISFSRKLSWLNNMLWGGSALLAFEHVWHGEIVPWFPFITAVSDSSALSEMLHEMVTAGTAMSVAVTAVWLCMVGVSNMIEKRAAENRDAAAGENVIS